MQRVNPKRLGFTGFELLIVIGLVGLLAWLVVSRFSDLSTVARNTERRLDLSIIAAELEAFHATVGHYPASATVLPSYSQFISQNSPTPDTIAYLDPVGNFIENAPTASTNLPATGYDPAETPEGSQYTYAPYNCSPTTPAVAEPETETETDQTAEADPETSEDSVDETAESFDSCQSYVIYAWMENDLVYSKVSNN